MSWLDISLFIIWAGFTFHGFSKGLIRLLGRLLGLIIGAIIASHFYVELYNWSQNFFTWRESVGQILSFIILFVICVTLVDWLFVWLEKLFKLISIIPFTKLINRILGAFLGFLEGALFLGLIVYMVSRYDWIDSLLGNQLADSGLVPFLLWFVQLMLPILPKAIQTAQAVINPITN